MNPNTTPKFNDIFFPGLTREEILSHVMSGEKIPHRYTIATTILDDDFISPQEIAHKYGFEYTSTQLDHLADTLPDDKTLWWLRQNDYVLLSGPNMNNNLVNLHGLDPKLFPIHEKSLFRRDNWHYHSYAHNEVVLVGEWLMIKKVQVPYGFINWADFEKTHKTPATTPERVPTAVEVCYGLMVYWHLRQMHLILGSPVVTASVSDKGVRIRVNTEDNFGPHPPPHSFRDRGRLAIAKAINKTSAMC